MTIRRATSRILVFVLAAIAAAALYWLSAEFRPAGVLGAMQLWLAPLVFVPYLVAAVLGGNPHSPHSLLFGLALLAQFHVVFALLAWACRGLVEWDA